MMRVDPNYLQGLAASLNNTTANEATLTNELSSGLGLTSIGSNPVAVGQSTLLSAAISQDDSYVSAASSAQGVLQITDSALGEVVSQLTSAISLGVQASNGTENTSDSSTVANQLSGIQTEVLSLANTSYQGQYIFSGSQGSIQPFTQNTTTTPATTTYNGDTALQYTTTPSGQQIQTNLPGSSVFTATFTALNQIISDLSSGASSSVIQGDTATLSSALDSVINSRSVIDDSLTQVEATSSYTQTNATQLEAAQSALISADPASIATQLSNDETSAQALESTIATLGQNNLFTYLPH